MATRSPELLRADLAALAHRGLATAEFAHRAVRVLAEGLVFDGFCLLTMDPVSALPTGEVVENGLPPAAVTRLAEIESSGEDINTFAALADSTRPAAGLALSTGGDLDRSRRHRELRAPHGFGDELRAVLVGEHATWGALTLLRARHRAAFTPADTALVASVSGCLAEGLRSAAMPDGSGPRDGTGDDTVGFVLIAVDGTVTATDRPAQHWLAQLGGDRRGPLPLALRAVAGRAQRAGGDTSARVRAVSGQWLLLRATVLDSNPIAPVAVIIGPASGHQLEPLIAAVHGLTARERAVVALVAEGLPTIAIADRLHLSPWTVQDHLKTIFRKVGVGTRGELVARLFIGPGRP